MVDYFSKLVVLYPSQKTPTSKEFVRALLPRVSIFGVPKEIRIDGGSQFTSQLSSDLCSWLGYCHVVAVAYHPQANGLVERNKELLNHLRSLVYKKRIRDVWSYYLPLVQRILNYTVDGSMVTGMVEMSKTIWSSFEKGKQRWLGLPESFQKRISENEQRMGEKSVKK